MLEVFGLTKSFGSRRVLDAVDLAVAPGECVALLGGNGSGKTTTLRAIVGLALPDAGRIRVAGWDVRESPREARRYLSFLPQKSAFPPTLTVREALQVTARLRSLPDSRVEVELERCELAPLSEQAVATLSGGERQRLGLAVALLPEVPIHLFDEPTANLDARGLAVFLRRARELREEGRALLFTTHVVADVESLATRVEILNAGRIVPAEAGTAFGEPDGEVRVETRDTASRWIAAALELGARHARACGSRLYFFAPRSRRLAILAGLERRGLVCIDFRSARRWERMLDAAGEEQSDGENEKDTPVDRASAARGGLQ